MHTLYVIIGTALFFWYFFRKFVQIRQEYWFDKYIMAEMIHNRQVPPSVGEETNG